jgi:oligoribonuclease NrnB/cAMP/cGMP phosphodiesterase (DHH superfamily)
MSQVVCLYHDDCFDGLGSAWALSKRFPDAQFISVRYYEPIPTDLLDKSVYVVDFCYPLTELMQIAAIARELHVLDHHKGKEEVVEQFNQAIHALGWDPTKFRAIFDQSRSGAKLTWETLLPEYCTPSIIEFISDRDLWTFQHDETELVMAGLGSYPMDLAVWDELFQWSPDFSDRADDVMTSATIHPHFEAMNKLYDAGFVVVRKMKVDVDRIISLAERTIELQGYSVPFINIPRMLVSEALSKLAKNQPFAVGYFDTAEYREFSLRSTEDGIDVIDIAKPYGGGGHPRSAGFRIPRNHPLAQC